MSTMDERGMRPADAGAQPLLTVEGLSVEYTTARGVLRAVDDVSFELAAGGEALGLIGESGSGKTSLTSAIVRLLPRNATIAAGRIVLGGDEISALSDEAFRTQVRWSRIAVVVQGAMASLNPVLRIDTQMIEAVKAHHPEVSDNEARARARDALGQVGIPSPEERLKAYPHQFSGGMRQRVAIATALLNKPDLIIADEPTTALDVTIQGQILFEVQKLCRQTGTALIWITHDLSVVASLADEICVMYAGRIVEQGSVDDVLDRPAHPYTEGLLRSVPSANPRGQPLRQIPGMTPSLLNLPAGCAFRLRCEHADGACVETPDITVPVPGRRVRCFHPLLSAVPA